MDILYHREEHFRGGETSKNIVIGMSDGLTVPFALAAGISGAISAAHLVVTAGFAEIAAGSIAMGLGGYLAAKSEAEHYASERAREEAEIRDLPETEAAEVAEFFRQYGLTSEEYDPVVAGLRQRPAAWRDFMMRFELGLEETDPKRALRSATSAGSLMWNRFSAMRDWACTRVARSRRSCWYRSSAASIFPFDIWRTRASTQASLI